MNRGAIFTTSAGSALASFQKQKARDYVYSPGELGLQYYLLATDLCFHMVNLQQIQREMYYKCPV